MPVKPLVSLALGLVLFAGLEGGQYFLNNRLQELALLALLGLFGYAAAHTALRGRDLNWSAWVFSAPALIAYVMGSSALAFAANAGTGVAPSLLAAREFLFILVAPTIYLLYRMGLELVIIERVFVTVLVLLALSYIFFYFRVDLQAAFFSDGYMHYLVTWDEWRGYRLKPTSFALVLLTVLALFHVLLRGAELQRLLWLVILGIAGYIWFLIKARSMMATVVLAVLAYSVAFIRPNRINVLVVGVPLGLLLALPVADFFVSHFMASSGGDVRAAAYATAWQVIGQHPVFGYGQSSAYSLTYQQIFGPKFFPSDLGMVGIWFKYGTVGVVLYLGLHFMILTRLVRANWLYRRAYGCHNPVLWAMLILLLALTANLVLNPGLAFAQGLTVASVAFALTAAYRHQVGRQWQTGQLARTL